MRARGIGSKAERRALIGVLATVLLGASAGCGGDEAGTSGRVASMVAVPAEPAEATAGRAAEQAPAVASIELEPRRPIAGARLRARAKLAPGSRANGARPEIAYRWLTRSGRSLGEGPELDTAGLEPGTVVVVVAQATAGDRTGEPFEREVRLAAQDSQIALVVIGARDGRQVGRTLTAVVETTDESDGFDAVELEWRVDGERAGDGEALDTSPFAPGDVVELRARLADAGENARVVHAEPLVLERGAPPEITSQPAVAVENGELRYAIAARSPLPGAELRFELLKGPDGMAVDPERGVLRWRPAPDQRGRFEVEVAVMDQWGSGVAQSFAVQADSNAAPPAAAR